MRLVDDRVIARTPAERRLLARILHAQGAARGVLAFRAADTHLHVVTNGSRTDAGFFARYAMMSLRWKLRLAAPFEPCRMRALVDQRHLENAVRYTFRQEAHHGIDADPTHDASSLVDLIGLRVLDEPTSRQFFAALPRVSHAALLQLGAFDIAAFDIAAFDPPPIALLLEATLAATGLATLTRCLSSEAGRLAAAHAVDAPAREVGPLLGIAAASVRRLRQRSAERRLVTAIQRQLALRSGLATRVRSA